MKHPKSIDRTYAQRCLDDLRIALMSDSTCPLLKQKDSHVSQYSATFALGLGCTL